MENLKDVLMTIDNNRFERIIEALKVCDICGECYHFNRSVTDVSKGYRCKCMPSCIAASLSEELIQYLNKKLGWI